MSTTLASKLHSRFPDEHEQDLVRRAQAGDAQARHDIIVSLTSYCERLARRYMAAYRWASPRLEADDLAQLGLLTALECLDKALVCDHPYPYLVVAVRHEMYEYCCAHASLITTPQVHTDRPAYPRMGTISLDKPLTPGEPATLVDVLPEPVQVAHEEPKHPALHQAVADLPKRQQETIRRHYGFDGPPESLNSISLSMATSTRSRPSCASTHIRLAHSKLRARLQEVYTYA